jgi:hypothetical protein
MEMMNRLGESTQKTPFFVIKNMTGIYVRACSGKLPSLVGKAVPSIQADQSLSIEDNDADGVSILLFDRIYQHALSYGAHSNLH